METNLNAQAEKPTYGKVILSSGGDHTLELQEFGEGYEKEIVVFDLFKRTVGVTTINSNRDVISSVHISGWNGVRLAWNVGRVVKSNHCLESETMGEHASITVEVP